MSPIFRRRSLGQLTQLHVSPKDEIDERDRELEDAHQALHDALIHVARLQRQDAMSFDTEESEARTSSSELKMLLVIARAELRQADAEFRECPGTDQIQKSRLVVRKLQVRLCPCQGKGGRGRRVVVAMVVVFRNDLKSVRRRARLRTRKCRARRNMQACATTRVAVTR